ncbi:MAG: hypothetical protein KJO62_02720 [Gammaproteobacteria bacterium]|nr:hypothetical protein [Gammaproteobacteria bacterium]RZV60238.1 MAG: hypothetical protein EX270_00120 [Pseudomonadales bacterium]
MRLARYFLVVACLAPLLANAQADEVVEGSTGALDQVLLQLSPRYFKPMDSSAIEIVGFGIARRNLLSSQVGIPDLEVVLVGDEQRWMPLARLMYAFQLEASGNKHQISFQPEFSEQVTLNLGNETINYGGSEEPLQFLAGFSDITGGREIFLPVETISRIFDIEVVWEYDLYQYTATTDNQLKIWRAELPDFMQQEMELVDNSMPMLFDAAEPARNSLDYVQTRAAASISKRENSDARVSISTSEDFWGGALGGRYELRFQQPNLSWQEGEGFNSGDENVWVPRRAMWTKTNDKSEVTLGDSSLSVNELVLPFVNLTGIRVGGLMGADSDDVSEAGGYGPSSRFARTERYDGIAELGSTVKLFINDSEVATAEVYEEPDSAVGFGRYEFDEVTIPQGNLVAIRIEIEEPGGRRIVRDLSTTSTNKLRPVGQFSYIGGIGTDRSKTEWDNQGLVGAGRVLYGISDSLTLGATLGYQDGIDQQSSGLLGTVSRIRPESSEHVGAELIAKPFSKLILSAAFATSSGDDGSDTANSETRYEGDSFTADIDYFFRPRMSLRGRAYRYEPNFFNGRDIGLEDREGYYVAAQARMSKFAVSTHYGSIENNLDDQLSQTSTADYYGLNLSTSSLLRNTYLWAEVDTVEPDEFDRKTYIAGGFRSSLRGFNISSTISEGDLFELAIPARELFQNIALPYLRITGSPSSSFSISKGFGQHSFVLELDGPETSIDERGTLTHYWDGYRRRGGFLGAGAIRLVTELGYNQASKSEFATNRLNLYLDKRRSNRLGMVSSYDSIAGWSWSLDMSFTNIFALRAGRIINVSSGYASPGLGGTSGVVFLDKNANGKQDWGEQGIPGIEIKSSEVYAENISDRWGEFFISRRSDQHETEVYVDVTSVPATLVPVHARQKVKLERGLTSRVEFALAPMVSLTGYLQEPLPAGADASQPPPIRGARIELSKPDGTVVGESITASDGSYYFNAIPGEYQLWVDPRSVDPEFVFNEPAFSASIVGQEEYQEVEFVPIVAEKLVAAPQATVLRKPVSTPDTAPTITSPDSVPATSAADAPIAGSQTTAPAGLAPEATPPAADALPEGLDLSRPRIAPPPELRGEAQDNFVGITHLVSGSLLGELENRSGFTPIEGVTLLLLDPAGEQIGEVTTGQSGTFSFDLEAGNYRIAIDPLSIPLKYVYEVPAMSIKVPRKERKQKITLKPIRAFYLELDN